MTQDLPDFLAVDWNGTVVPFFGRAPYPDAIETLGRLRGAGSTLVVVSNASQLTIADDVARTGIAVDEVIGCHDKAPVFSDLRMRYGRGLALGDHPSDLRAAKEAGLVFFQAILEGQAGLQGRDGAFQTWSELSELLAAV